MINREIRVFGLMRSGQHGIINWLMAQKPFKDNTVFLNNQKFGNDPVGLDGKMCLIQNYEDVGLAELRWYMLNSEIAANVTNILVVRDAPNFFASRIAFQAGAKHGKQLTAANKDEVAGQWAQYAREFLGETDHLPRKILVDFGRWFSDREYRRGLAKELGLKFSDAGLNCISGHGKGSSFDGTDFNGKAQHMAVLTRYKAMEGNALWESLDNEPEIIRLSGALADYKPKRKQDRMKLRQILLHPAFIPAKKIPAKIQANIEGRIAGTRRPPLLYTIKVMLGAKCKTYLEVGVLHGGCMACVMQNKYATKFVGVDVFGFKGRRPDARSGVPVTKTRATANIKRNNIHGHKFSLIRGASHDPATFAKVEKECPVVDLLFIDADHSESAVYNDFNSYGQLVRPGGIVVFDNYGGKRWQGCRRAVQRSDLTKWHTVGEWKEGLILERK